MQLREWLLFHPDPAQTYQVTRARGLYPFVWHYHEQYEVFLVQQGAGHWLIGDRVGQYAPGDLFLLGPRLPHAFYTPHAGTAQTPQDNGVIMFTFPGEDAAFASTPELRELVPLLEQARSGIWVGRAAATRAMERLHRVETGMGLSGWLALLDGLLAIQQAPEFQVLASAHYQAPSAPGQAQRINLVCRFLHEHVKEPVALAQVADVANTSIPHLCALFKESTGQTVMGYLQELRISHACHLLITTSTPITDIAAQSGFTSLSSFNRQFQTLRGMSPRAYRQCFPRETGEE